MSMMTVFAFYWLTFPSFSCGLRLDLEPLKYIYAMAFAVEEINRNSTLLPGVKLGYRILDSCSRYPWALGGALSLVGGDTHSCNLTASTTHSAREQGGETAGMTWYDFGMPLNENNLYDYGIKDFLMQSAGDQPVPLLIAAASSTTGIILSRILGPLSVPVVSFITLRNKPLISHFLYSLHQEVNTIFWTF